MTADDYVAKATALDRQGVVDLWAQVENGTTEGEWPAGKALEYLLLRAFQFEGAEVTWPYEVSLEGEQVEQIDGAVFAERLWCLVEAKDQAGKVNAEPIAKMRSQLLRRPAGTIGVVFSRRGFTEAAKVLARYMMPQAVLLWEGSELGSALSSGEMIRGLVTKHRHAVEHGVPDFSLAAEETQ